MLKLKVKLAASLIIVILLIIFTLQNMTTVTVRFIIGAPVAIPLAYLLYASILFGMILVGIAFLTRTFRMRNLQKKVLAQQEALRQISQNLMVQPVEPQLASLPQSQSQPQPEEPSAARGPRGGASPAFASTSKDSHIGSPPAPQASVENTVENTPAQGLFNNHSSPNDWKDKIRNFNPQKIRKNG